MNPPLAWQCLEVGVRGQAENLEIPENNTLQNTEVWSCGTILEKLQALRDVKGSDKSELGENPQGTCVPGELNLGKA